MVEELTLYRQEALLEKGSPGVFLDQQPRPHIWAHFYVWPRHTVYASSHIRMNLSGRCTVTLLLSPTSTPFVVQFKDGTIVHSCALYIAPEVKHTLISPAPIIVIDFEPHSDIFHSLIQNLSPQPYINFAHKRLDAFKDELLALIKGSVSCCNAFALIWEVTDCLMGPRPQTRECRTKELARQLLRTPDLQSIRQVDAARDISLSPGRFSHLFTDEMGTSFKRFLLWAKVRRTYSLFPSPASLTDIAHHAGFSDSAHMARTFSSMFGGTLSTLGDNALTTLCGCSQSFI